MRRSIHSISRLIISQIATYRLPVPNLRVTRKAVTRKAVTRKTVGLIALPVMLPFVLALNGCDNQAYDSVEIAPAQDTVNTAQTVPPQLMITYPEMSSENDSAFIQVAENNLVVTQVGARDIDGSKLIYRLQDGEDMNKFLMDEGTGTLSFKEVPDWESPTDSDSNNNYMVLWQVLSSTGKARSQYLIVQVTDIPD